MRVEDKTVFCCRVCSGTEKSGTYEAREMMFGFRTQFHYAQCDDCGSLYLTDPPSDYSQYYSGEYYSFASGRGGAREWIRDYLRAKRDSTYFGEGGVAGKLLARYFEEGALLSVSKLKVQREARILDVGCGDGKLLQRMAAFGFMNLVGVDPFLSCEIDSGNGLRIRKGRLEDLTGERFDVVMFHHSLEHVPNPVATLRTAASVLVPGGKCLVRLPIVSYAWEEYRTNWYGLDPPRHMWIPTEKAMGLLAQAVGLNVEKVEYDSTAIQFWGSELWEKDIPLMDVGFQNLRGRLFIGKMKKFRRRAEALNLAGRGDIAIFLLSRQ